MAKCPFLNPVSGDCEAKLCLDEPCYGERNRCDSCLADDADTEMLNLKTRVKRLEGLLENHSIPFEPFDD